VQQAVAKGVAGGRRADRAIREAEAKMVKSKKYRAWADTLSDSDKAKLSSGGVAAFLLAPTEEEPQQ
jgi:hypothetical protein